MPSTTNFTPASFELGYDVVGVLEDHFSLDAVVVLISCFASGVAGGQLVGMVRVLLKQDSGSLVFLWLLAIAVGIVRPMVLALTGFPVLAM